MHTKSIILCLISSFFVFATEVSATSLGLSLFPSLLTINTLPGKTISQTYLLKNLSPLPSSFVVHLVPFAPGNIDNTPVLKPNLAPAWLKYFSITNNGIKFDEPFTLKGDESKQLILTISVPRSANSSDIYASLLVSTVPTENSHGSNIGATLGSNILITVSPMSHPPTIVKIGNFTPKKSSYLFRYGDLYIADNLSKITIMAKARNFGKYFTQTTGTLKVSQADKVIYTQNLLSTNLLANSERYLSASTSGDLSYQAKITDVGEYRVSIDIISENSTSHDEITMFFLPVTATFTGLVMIIVSLLIIKIMRKDVSHTNH